MASFLEKEKESAKLEIPPLNYSFISGGFVNPKVIRCKGKERAMDMEEAFKSLSIDMVEVEDQEMTNTGLPPFPQGQTLNNWTSIELLVVFKFQNE